MQTSVFVEENGKCGACNMCRKSVIVGKLTLTNGTAGVWLVPCLFVLHILYAYIYVYEMTVCSLWLIQ